MGPLIFLFEQEANKKIPQKANSRIILFGLYIAGIEVNNKAGYYSIEEKVQKSLCFPYLAFMLIWVLSSLQD